MKPIFVLAAWAGVASVGFAQGQMLPRLGQQPAAPGFQIQKNGLPVGFGANGLNGGINNNNNVNAFNNLNGFNAFNNGFNRGFNPMVSPFAGGYGGGWNPYAGYNPYLSPYNTGFANPGWGFYPQTPYTWSSYNLSPLMPGVSPYGLPYGSPYGPGYQMPPWYNGVSPAPIVGISGPPFGVFPGVQ